MFCYPSLGKSIFIRFNNFNPQRESESLSSNLQGVSVYQNMNEKTGKVERSVMTFRVITEDDRGTGKWEYPVKPGEKFLEEANKWVQDAWQRDILPELKKKYESK